MKKNNWWDYPQKIKNWNENIDYVMFIDENGNSGSIKDISRKILDGELISDDEKYFTITGCIFERKNYSMMRNSIRKLKEKYWQDGFYYDTKHNNIRYVCFHSREIRMHFGAFNDKLINYKEFINELSNTLNKIECKIISVSINLVEYIVRNENLPVYEKAFDLLLERYVYATKNNKKGIIMFESRGKKDDNRLLKHIVDIIKNKGTNRISSRELSNKIVGVYFNPKWYDGFSATYVGLEITDLFSYPIYQKIKYKEDNLAFKIIENKIDCYPSYINKGLKIYPNEKNDINRS